MDLFRLRVLFVQVGSVRLPPFFLFLYDHVSDLLRAPQHVCVTMDLDLKVNARTTTTGQPGQQQQRTHATRAGVAKLCLPLHGDLYFFMYCGAQYRCTSNYTVCF